MDMRLDILKCGEDSSGRFYDRKGDYFREGIDPRNYYGRLVPIELGHDDDCPAKWTYTEKCRCSKATKIARVDNTVYWLSDNNTVMRKVNA